MPQTLANGRLSLYNLSEHRLLETHIKASAEGFVLGFSREKQWVIERLLGGEHDEPEWDTLGSIVGSEDAASAIAAARSNWRDLRSDAESRLRAVAWSEATAEQRTAAEYENSLRAREEGIRGHERDVVSQLSSMSAAMRGAEWGVTAKPERNDQVILGTGAVARISATITERPDGQMIELEDGLWIKVEPNPDKTSPIPWREVSDGQRP